MARPTDKQKEYLKQEYGYIETDEVPESLLIDINKSFGFARWNLQQEAQKLLNQIKKVFNGN